METGEVANPIFARSDANDTVVVPKLPAGTGVNVYQAAVVLPFVTFFFVAARFYARFIVLRRKPTIDDYIVFLTLVAIIAYSVTIGIATYNGMGLHVWQYTPELNSKYYLWLGISSEFYCLALAGFKSALILLYLQTFGLVSRNFRIACYLTLFYTISYLLANLLTQFLGCTPVAKFWHPDLPGHCINKTAANTFFGVGHVTSDLIIGILPLPAIWKLSWPTTRQKIGLSLSLTCGFLAWAVATVRYVISTYDQFTYDRTWWAGIGFTLSILEVNTGLMCACVPTLSPLLSHYYGRRTKRLSITYEEGRFESSDKTPWDDLQLNTFQDALEVLPSNESDRRQSRWGRLASNTPPSASMTLERGKSPAELVASLPRVKLGGSQFR